MFKLPSKLDSVTLRKVFNHPLYIRLLRNSPRLRMAAKSRGIFNRLQLNIL